MQFNEPKIEFVCIKPEEVVVAASGCTDGVSGCTTTYSGGVQDCTGDIPSDVPGCNVY